MMFLSQYFYTNIPIRLVDEDANDKNDIKNIYAETLNHDDSRYKYEDINCSSISDYLKGSIIIKSKKRIAKPKVQDINFDFTYLYDEKLCKLVPAKVGMIKTGIYRIFTYTNISKELYNEIKAKEKNIGRLCKSLKSLAIEENKEIKLMFSEDDNINIGYYRLPQYCDEKEKKIFYDSGLPYYEELLFEYSNHKSIYVKNEKFIELETCVYRQLINYREYFNEDDNEKNNAYLYNKDILISNFIPIFCHTPYRIEGLYGYINSHKLPIVLDVSRNRIISGTKELAKEFNITLLKYQREKEKDSVLSEMLEGLIKLLEE